ncbi:MAG: hypothetical protein FD175_941 [Beijerinckiaceae bacterium]|nr:MAG: hypothetical protein FD175_941 [Beijerinckiaceae bacterium]
MKGRIILAMFCLLSGLASASACQCIDIGGFSGGARKTEKEIRAERLKKAKVVVRGLVVSAKAGEDIQWPVGTKFDANGNVAAATNVGALAVLAEIRVVETRKGSVESLIKIYSGFGIGDCGIGPAFVMAVSMKRPLTLGLEPIASAPNSYTIDMCSYIDTEK